MKSLYRWLGATALLVSFVMAVSWSAGVTDLLDLCTGKNQSNCPFKVDATGNVTAGGSVTATGATLTGNQSMTGLLNYTSTDMNGITQSTTVLPSATFMTLESTGVAGNLVTMTSLPSISTATTLGGTTAWPDGTFLVLGSSVSASTHIVVFQDNGTLSGSQLHLGSTSRQVGPDKVLTLIYNAKQNFWNEVSYANNN